MGRTRKGSIERVAVVRLASDVQRCAAELKHCIRASTCARRLALISVREPQNFALDAGFNANSCSRFLRALEHLDRGAVL